MTCLSDHRGCVAALYDLAEEMRRNGCVASQPELVEQAAALIDGQTITINELLRQLGQKENHEHH